VLLLSALLLIIGTDSLLQAGVRLRRKIKPQEIVTGSKQP